MDIEERTRKVELKIANPPVDYEYIKKELETGINLNDIDPPVLFYADDYELALFLLENGADPNVWDGFKNKDLDDSYKYSGFQSIVCKKYKNKEEHHKIIKLAIEKGANVNYKDAKGRTALDYIIRGNDRKLIELLKSYGAEIGDPNYNNNVFIGKLKPNPFDEKIYLEDKIKVIQKFIDNGYDLNIVYTDKEDEQEKTILNYCVEIQSYYRYKMSTNVTELLLKSGANPNFYYEYEEPPLHTAIRSIYANFYSCLNPWKIENEIDDDDIIPNPIEVLELLVKYGADINLVNSDGHTPLDLAVITQNVWGQEFLTEHGAKHSEGYIEERGVLLDSYYKCAVKEYKLRYKLQEVMKKNSYRYDFNDVFYNERALESIDLPEIHRIVLYYNFSSGNFDFSKDKFIERNMDNIKNSILKVKDINERDKNGFTVLDYKEYIDRVMSDTLNFIRKNGGKHSLELDFPEDFKKFYTSDYKIN